MSTRRKSESERGGFTYCCNPKGISKADTVFGFRRCGYSVDSATATIASLKALYKH